MRRSRRSRSSARNSTQRYNYRPDHNGIKGYTAVYLVKYVTEKIGKFDRKAFGAAMKGLTLTPDDRARAS